MIEEHIVKYLTESLSVPVSCERPTDSVSKYIIVQKTGSQTNNRVEVAKVAVQSIAPTLLEAGKLNDLVKAVMADAPDHVDCIFSCLIDSDYNWTNTNTKERRYQAVFDITFKE